MEQSNSVLLSSLQNMSFGIILQVIVRAVTFVSNACILRYISPDALGVMNVRLLLFESTVLFLSREAFRKASLDNVREHNWPQVINLVWLCFPISMIISLVCSGIWLFILEAPAEHLQEQYNVGVYVMATSCIIEMIAEAPILVTQAFLFNKLKIILNLLHLFVRNAIFLPGVLYSPEHSVHAFSAAQIIATLVFVLGHYVYFYFYCKNNRTVENFPFHSVIDFLPSFDQTHWLNRQSVLLAWTLFKTMVVKQLLTEGERYIMTITGVLNLTQQGIYDVVNSLGTLPARLLLRPIEENFYFYFAQRFRRGHIVVHLDQRRMAEASKLLYFAMHCMVIFGLTVSVFGWSYSKLLLFLYGGENLAETSGQILLRAHCVAILFLAINGITEGFGQAVMDEDELTLYNMVMVILSIAFLVMSWILTNLFGGLGFIVANCCNMATRICYSFFIMKKQYEGSQLQPLRGLLPGPLTTSALICAFIFTSVSEHLMYDSMKVTHFSVGAVCFVTTCIVFFFEEKELRKISTEKISLIFGFSEAEVHDHQE